MFGDKRLFICPRAAPVGSFQVAYAVDQAFKGIGGRVIYFLILAVPFRPVEDQEIRRRVMAAFARLPLRQREVCSLRLIGGLTLEEIAKIAGVSLGTVKSRLFYGQRQLRDLLSDLDPRRNMKGS